MNFRLSLTHMKYNELTDEQKNVLSVYNNMTNIRSAFTCNKDLSSLFDVNSTSEGLYLLNKNVRKILLEKFVFGFKFYTSYYYREDGTKRGQIGFESKNFGIFGTVNQIDNFKRSLFIGYIKEKNLVYCNSYMANCLNEFFKYYKKDILLTIGKDKNVMKIFEHDLNWYSLGEIQELYKKIRKESDEVYFKALTGEELIKLLEENGYSIVRIKASSSKFIPLEERKNYPIVETKGTKRYFIKTEMKNKENTK